MASSVWWPGISQDITKIVQNCTVCEKYRRERIEPMKSTDFPDRPWSRVGVDFFQHKDKHSLLAVDYFLRDVEICLVSKNVNSSQTVLQLKKIFSRHRVLDIFSYLPTTAPSLIRASSPTFSLTGSFRTLPQLQDISSPPVKWKWRSKL